MTSFVYLQLTRTESRSHSGWSCDRLRLSICLSGYRSGPASPQPQLVGPMMCRGRSQFRCPLKAPWCEWDDSRSICPRYRCCWKACCWRPSDSAEKPSEPSSHDEDDHDDKGDWLLEEKMKMFQVVVKVQRVKCQRSELQSQTSSHPGKLTFRSPDLLKWVFFRADSPIRTSSESRIDINR